MSASVHKIAKAAGVSPRTVSNALRSVEKGVRSDAKERAERIRRIATKMGYRPNTAARAMARKRFNALGVVRTEDPGFGTLPSSVQWGIQEVLREIDYHLVVGQVSEQRIDGPEQLPRLMREWTVDGVILCYCNAPEVLLDAVEQWNLKAVWFNMKRSHDSVRPDDQGSAVQVTRQLLEMGHRRVAYLVNGAEGHYSVTDRKNGYTAAMGEAGLSPVILTPPHRKPNAPHARAQIAWARELLQREDRPTAVLAYSGDDSVWFIEGARQAGLAVPTDLSMIGYSERTIGLMPYTPAALHLPHAEMGRQLAHMLLRRIDADAGPETACVVPVRIDHGETVAPPGASQRVF